MKVHLQQQDLPNSDRYHLALTSSGWRRPSGSGQRADGKESSYDDDGTRSSHDAGTSLLLCFLLLVAGRGAGAATVAEPSFRRDEVFVAVFTLTRRFAGLRMLVLLFSRRGQNRRGLSVRV